VGTVSDAHQQLEPGVQDAQEMMLDRLVEPRSQIGFRPLAHLPSRRQSA
jgi:hypothetical protein